MDGQHDASVTSYQVLRSSNGSSYSVIATLGKGTTTYGDTAVSGGTTYSYEVRAVAPSGSATSGTASAAPPVLCL